MKKLLLLSLLSFPVYAQTPVYFYCDTALTIIGKCGITVNALPKVDVDTVVINSIQTCKYDVTSLLPGSSNTLKCTAIAISDPVWGSQESASAQMTYNKGVSTLTAPNHLRVGP